MQSKPPKWFVIGYLICHPIKAYKLFKEGCKAGWEDAKKAETAR